MENRDRDKVSHNTGSTEAGDVNRKTSQNIGQKKNDSSTDFGQKIGRSEDLENEPNRKRDSGGSGGMQSDRGRNSGSSGFGSGSGSSSESL